MCIFLYTRLRRLPCITMNLAQSTVRTRIGVCIHRLRCVCVCVCIFERRLSPSPSSPSSSCGTRACNSTPRCLIAVYFLFGSLMVSACALVCSSARVLVCACIQMCMCHTTCRRTRHACEGQCAQAHARRLFACAENITNHRGAIRCARAPYSGVDDVDGSRITVVWSRTYDGCRGCGANRTLR